METGEFPKLVRKYFGYLVDDFDYSVEDKPNNIGPFNYGVIEFRSPKTTIQVGREQDRPTDVVYVQVKPSKAPNEVSKSLRWIVDALGIKADLPDDFTPPQQLENSLKKYAFCLKEHCLEFILGDFSKWDRVLKYFIEKKKEHYRSLTGIELPENTFQAIEHYLKSNIDNGSG